jgi:hypothetical protein
MMKLLAILTMFTLGACSDGVTVDVVDRANTQTTAYKPGSKVVVDNTRDSQLWPTVPQMVVWAV